MPIALSCSWNIACCWMSFRCIFQTCRRQPCPEMGLPRKGYVAPCWQPHRFSDPGSYCNHWEAKQPATVTPAESLALWLEPSGKKGRCWVNPNQSASSNAVLWTLGASSLKEVWPIAQLQRQTKVHVVLGPALPIKIFLTHALNITPGTWPKRRCYTIARDNHLDRGLPCANLLGVGRRIAATVHGPRA